MPGLTGNAPAPAKKGKAKPRGEPDTSLTPTAPETAPGGQIRLPGSNAASPTAPGQKFTPQAPSPGMWNAPVSTSTLENEQIPITDASGDTLGIHALFPKGTIVAGTDEAYKAAVAKMSRANQQNLADVLVNAGILAVHSTGKPYTTSEVQGALGSALAQTSQNQDPKTGKVPSLTSFLSNAIQQTTGSGTTTTGTAATTVANSQAALSADMTNSFTKIAGDYQIPVSDAAVAAHAQAYLAQGLDSTQATAEFTDYAKQVAAGLYPTLAPQINAGVDMTTLLDPYKNLIEKTIGVDPSTIDFSQPQYAKFLSGNVDPATGRPAPMTLSQVSQTLMSDPSYGYQNTQEAKNTASSLTASILKTFGAIGNDNVSLSMSGPTPDLAST